MSSVHYIHNVPFQEMPLIQIDSSVLSSLMEKTKNLTSELEQILNHQSISSVQSKPIIVRKPIDLLYQIEKDDSVDPYDQLLKLADALSIYEKTGDKIGNDFKHLFEKLFVKECLKLRSIGTQGCLGLNTVFLSTVVKVRDIKWLLYLIAIFHGYKQLFQLTEEHAKEYSKIGSRDCQIFMNKLVKSNSSRDCSIIYTIFIKTLIEDKNLEECKKLVSQGVTAYKNRDIEHCVHSNCLEECYTKYCFESKLNDEIDLIKYQIIDKLYNDMDKALEILNWLVYEYPSRLGYKIKVEKNGKEYLDNIIKEYCEKKNKMYFYNQYIGSSRQILNLSSLDFYIDKGQKGNILCTTEKDTLFIMFYNESYNSNSNTSSNIKQILSIFPQLLNACKVSKIKFGICNLGIYKDIELKMSQTIMPLKDNSTFILYVDGKPAMRYEGEKTVTNIIKFINDFIQHLPR